MRANSGETLEGSTVALTIPSDAEFVALLRTMVGGVAARDNFTLDQIDDVRLATEEAAIQLLKRTSGEQIVCRVTVGPTRMTVCLDADVEGHEPVIDESSLSWVILRALVDELDVQMQEGHAAIEMSKHRTVFATQGAAG